MSNKPAEIYIGKRIVVRKEEGAGGAGYNTLAIYFKPDNAPKYCQLDLNISTIKRGKKKYKTYRINSIFHGTGLPEDYEVFDKDLIDDKMLKTFDLLDSLYE